LSATSPFGQLDFGGLLIFFKIFFLANFLTIIATAAILSMANTLSDREDLLSGF
jgi:hypothetical protein